VLRKEGEGPVTAGDIQTRTTSRSSTRARHRHLAQGGKLDMQIKVEKGRGYVPGNLRRYGDEPTKSIGRIVLDASFSPVAASATRWRTPASSSAPTSTSW
jgi:DNA-directed RNA polymerase subunit alpha